MQLSVNHETYSLTTGQPALPSSCRVYPKPGEMMLVNPAAAEPHAGYGRFDFSRSSLPEHLHTLLTPRAGYSAGQHFAQHYPYMLHAALSVTAQQGAISLAPYHAGSDHCALVIERQAQVKLDFPPLQDLTLSYIGLNSYFTEVRFYNRAGRIVTFRRLSAVKKTHEAFYFPGIKPTTMIIETQLRSSILLDALVWNQTVEYPCAR